MPVRSHHTVVPTREQTIVLVEDGWATEVVPQLPVRPVR